jgi:hypothetical protein
MAFQYNGSPISIDRPFTAPDGTKYANFATLPFVKHSVLQR